MTNVTHLSTNPYFVFTTIVVMVIFIIMITVLCIPPPTYTRQTKKRANTCLLSAAIGAKSKRGYGTPPDTIGLQNQRAGTEAGARSKRSGTGGSQTSDRIGNPEARAAVCQAGLCVRARQYYYCLFDKTGLDT